MPRFVVAEREDAEEEESSSEEEQSEEEEEQLESVAFDGQEADAGQAAAEAARAETNGQAGGSGAGGSGARSKLKIQLGGNKGKLVCHVRAPSYLLSVWGLVRWAVKQCIPVVWPATRAQKTSVCLTECLGCLSEPRHCVCCSWHGVEAIYVLLV